MAHFDLPEADLQCYRSSVVPPPDLDAFWTGTLDDARVLGSPPEAEPAASGLCLVDTWDVRFAGFGGQSVHAWYRRPAGACGDLPTVVTFKGYSGGRGLAHQVNPWALAGYATLDVDTRGQGYNHLSPGITPDPVGSGPATPGFLTRGIDSRDDYYYRRVFTDAVLVVEGAKQLSGVDPDRVVVAGVSQGGGIALAVAGLTDGVAAVLCDVPFLCDLPRAVALATCPPYDELTRYLSGNVMSGTEVFDTLSYFDGAILARGAQAPALFSVGLMDAVCPPSTVYAAYNAYAGPKEIRVYPYNGHEGGSQLHVAAQLRWLRDVISAT